MADIKLCEIAEAHRGHMWHQHVVEGLRSYGLYHHCPGVGFPDSMYDLEQAMAKVIWDTSRFDEGTISATGANNVARALIAAGYGVFRPEQPSSPPALAIVPGRVMEIPEPPEHPLAEVLGRIAENIENLGVDNDAISRIAGALDDIDRRMG